MLERIIEASVNNRFLVIIFTLLIALGGLYAMLKTPVDAIPDLSDVQVIIFTEYQGQAPQVVAPGRRLRSEADVHNALVEHVEHAFAVEVEQHLLEPLGLDDDPIAFADLEVGAIAVGRAELFGRNRAEETAVLGRHERIEVIEKKIHEIRVEIVRIEMLNTDPVYRCWAENGLGSVDCPRIN